MESRRQDPVDTLTLPSGRTLAWTVYGGTLHAPKGKAAPAAIFYFHGMPGSRIEGRFWPEDLLQKHNARCISVDRPGMGQSTYDPARRVLDWPADILAIADHLRIAQFYVVGASGGGPYAFACAKEIPRAQLNGTGRLRGVAAISAMYPTSLGTAGMMMSFRVLLGMGWIMPTLMTSWLLEKTFGSVARNPDPAVMENALAKVMKDRQEKEQRLFEDPHIRSTIVDAARESFREGSEGNAVEVALLSDWGFELTDLDGEGISLWHGKEDINVPFQMAEKAAVLLPKAKATFFEGETHLSAAVNHFEDILTTLLNS